MIEHANYLLNQWGIWCLTGREQLGYPRQTSFLNGQPSPPKEGGSLAICDDQALMVQRAVNELDGDLKKLVVLYYVKMRSCTMDAIARSMKCARPTVYDKMHRAHQRIMFAIHEFESRPGRMD